MIDFREIFLKNYNKLNAEQKDAVDTIDGPVLVIAGPGTGKTQLLSTRIAKILNSTDAEPSNILAMTFTDAGAENMRERLSGLIGDDAYKVGIFTYHAFGNYLISNFRQYFIGRNLEKQISDIERRKITLKLQEDLPKDSLLKNIDASTIEHAISEFKKSLLSPDEVRKIITENLELDKIFHEEIAKLGWNSIKNARKLEKIAPIYLEVIEIIERILPKKSANRYQGANLSIYLEDLKNAFNQAELEQKTKPLNDWKKNFLNAKSANDTPINRDFHNNKKMLELVDFYQKVLEEYAENGFFYFDDMILEVILALQNNDEFKFTLQEKYQYILLDEYQDTNKSQSRIIELLTDNPANENRPNILAVGDDDQAIYAFQGAVSSNMVDFFGRYRDTKVINLTRNYRSHEDILFAAKNVAQKITDRITENLPIKIEKNITAENPQINSKKSILERLDFKSDISENSWIAKKIKTLIDSGVQPKDIAILSRKHKKLQEIVPYLKNLDIPVSYEKKENLLKNATILQIRKIAELIISIRDKTEKMFELFPEVLSYDFWGLDQVDVWKLSWRASENSRKNSEENFWIKEMLFGENENLQKIAKMMVILAENSKNKSLENMLDSILGTEEIENNDKKFRMPIRKFLSQQNEEVFYDSVMDLTVLRDHLRNYSGENQNIDSLIQFFNDYEKAGVNITNTNPHKTTDNAVQVMTAHSSKGLEFEYVFMTSVNKDGWNTSKGGDKSLTFPKNMSFAITGSDSEDTRKRLFFVALTRAKTSLFLTNSTSKMNGNNNSRLDFIDEGGSVGEEICGILPQKNSKIITPENENLELEDIEINWHSFYKVSNEKLENLLSQKLSNYQISATHLNSFVNLEYGGPQHFFENTILRFPSSQNVNSAIGTICHEVLNFMQNSINQDNEISTEKINNKILFESSKFKFSEKDTAEIIKSSQNILKNFLETQPEILKKGDIPEKSFRNDGVFVGLAHLNGKIDHIKIDKDNKKITVMDFKTGKIPISKTSGKINLSSSKIYRYEQQLYFYKILVENCQEFNGYSVEKGILNFIEPDDNLGISHFLQEFYFDKTKEDYIKLLIQAIFSRVKNFDFSYDYDFSENLTGIKLFETELIKEFARKNNMKNIIGWEESNKRFVLKNITLPDVN